MFNGNWLIEKGSTYLLDVILIWIGANEKENIYENLKNLSTLQQWKIQSYFLQWVK